MRVVGRLVALIGCWVEHGCGIGAFTTAAATTTATATAAAEAAVESQEEYDDSNNNADDGGPPTRSLVRGSHVEEIWGNLCVLAVCFGHAIVPAPLRCLVGAGERVEAGLECRHRGELKW